MHFANIQQGRESALVVSVLPFHELQSYVDAYVVAHDQAAGLGHAVPAETEILSVDLAASCDAGAGVAPGVLDHAAKFRVQLYVLRNAMNGQVAVYFIGTVII